MKLRNVLLGAALAFAARAALPRLLLLKFAPAVARLNAGDYKPLLDNYADDFVLHFHEGPHRWSGDWVGKAGFDAFLQNFTAAGRIGEIKAVATSGPLWALTMWVRFDDHADGTDGTRLYENQTVLVLRTRWGKVVEQEDFYLDTERIARFDRKLAELGIEPIADPGSAG
jgi:ketosteroid isomerase-like protein